MFYKRYGGQVYASPELIPRASEHRIYSLYPRILALEALFRECSACYVFRYDYHIQAWPFLKSFVTVLLWGSHMSYSAVEFVKSLLVRPVGNDQPEGTIVYICLCTLRGGVSLLALEYGWFY